MQKLAATSSQSARALEVTILTLARTAEVQTMRWSQLDLHNGIWDLGVLGTKNERLKRTPLYRAYKMRDHAKGSSQELAASGDPDAVLIHLENQFWALVAELDGHDGDLAHSDEYLTIEDEAVLARLDPVERAIMETPAYTMTGLTVKARHLAYVLSEYWEAPIGEIAWEGRAVRLLVETICNVANAPLRIGEPKLGK